MKQKLLIFTFLTLFLFSFASPIYAETSSGSLNIWDKIKIFLTSFISNKPIDLQRDKIASTYSDNSNNSGDITTRVVPESARTQKKFNYIIGVIDDKYDNQKLGKCPGSDNPVTVLDLAHYLNSRNLINLSTDIQDKLNKYPSPGIFNYACYEKLFDELHIVPPKERKEGAETYVLNETTRYIIPEQYQDTNLSTIKDIKEDTAQQTETMYKQIIPHNNQGSGYKELKQQFDSWLQPNSWQN
jgi:hypothetical protein